MADNLGRTAVFFLLLAGLPSPARAQSEEISPFSFKVGLRFEAWEADLRCGCVDTFGPLTSYRLQEALAMATGAIEFRPFADLALTAHIGLGVERQSPELSGGNTSVSWHMDPNPVFETGLGGRWNFGAIDVGVSGDFRIGRSDATVFFPFRDGGSADLSYRYWYLRPQVTLGWEITGAIRPYVGLRYTAYHGKLAGSSGIELRQPIGAVLGVEITAAPIRAAFELQFLDVDLGLGASVNFRF